MASTRPSRIIRPARKLNEDNIGELQLASHRNFVEAAKNDLTGTSAISTDTSEPSMQAESMPESELVCGDAHKRRVAPGLDSNASLSDNNDDDSGSESQATETQHKSSKSKKKTKKKKTVAQGMTTVYCFCYD